MINASPEKDSPEFAGARFSIQLQVLICLAMYAVLWRLFIAFNALPQNAYEGPVILAGALTNGPTLLFLACGSIVLFLRRQEISWESIDPEMQARGFVFLVQVPLVLQFAFYDYNYFYDHTHLADRLAIIALWLLVARHPAFLFPFACMAMFVLYQFFYPLPGGGANWPDKLLPVHILFLLNAFVFLRLYVKFDRSVLLLSTLVLTGGFYAHSALSKLVLGPHLSSWLMEDQINYLFVAAYKNGGWLSHLADQQIVDIASWMKPYGVAQNATTLLVEGGAVLIIMSRWSTRIVLAACIALHIAILASSSIFFWKWIVVDGLLLIYAEKYWRSVGTEQLSARSRWLLTCLAVAVSFFKLYSEGPLFAWWDTRHCKYCTYEVETVDGERVPLDPHYFAPYDLTFVQSRYYYAVPRKVIPGTFGVNYDLDAVRALNDMQLGEFPDVVERFGTNFYNELQANTYRNFLRTYLTNAMKRDHKRWIPRWFPPPYHFQATVPSEAYDDGSRVVKLFVYFEEYFFDDKEIHQLSRSQILRIPIPGE